MNDIPKPILNLAERLRSLPGVGPKSAQRLAFYLFKSPPDVAESLAKSLLDLRESLTVCQTCFNIADSDPCSICGDRSRDQSLVCVVEDFLDMIAIERSGFKGVYHILGGVIAPNEGVGPGELSIDELSARIKKKPEIKELIVATNPTMEGEATALYLQRIFEPLGVKVSRIARGIPMGGSVEYIDEITLSKSIEGRQAV